MSQPKASLVIKPYDVTEKQEIPPFKVEVIPSSSLDVDQPYAIALWADGYKPLSFKGNYTPVLTASELQDVWDAGAEGRALTKAAKDEAIGLLMAEQALSLDEATRIVSTYVAVTQGTVSQISAQDILNYATAFTYRETGGTPYALPLGYVAPPEDPKIKALREGLEALRENREQSFQIDGTGIITTTYPVKRIVQVYQPDSTDVILYSEGGNPDTQNLSVSGSGVVTLPNGHTVLATWARTVPAELRDDGRIQLYPELVTHDDDGEEIQPHLCGWVDVEYEPKAPDLFRSSGESSGGLYGAIYQHFAVRSSIKKFSITVNEPEEDEEIVGARKVKVFIRDFCDDTLLSGAQVTISRAANGPIPAYGKVVTTDALGLANFGIMLYGTYQVSITKGGYVSSAADALSNETITINEQEII